MPDQSRAQVSAAIVFIFWGPDAATKAQRPKPNQMRRPESADSIALESKAYFGGNFISNKAGSEWAVSKEGENVLFVTG